MDCLRWITETAPTPHLRQIACCCLWNHPLMGLLGRRFQYCLRSPGGPPGTGAPVLELPLQITKELPLVAFDLSQRHAVDATSPACRPDLFPRRQEIHSVTYALIQVHDRLLRSFNRLVSNTSVSRPDGCLTLPAGIYNWHYRESMGRGLLMMAAGNVCT